MSDFDEVIRTRRSVGKVRDDAIDRSTILELIELATSAPNHHLHQPWRFMVVQAEGRRRLGDAHAAAFLRTHPDASAEVLAREAARFMRAPVVIVAIVEPAADDPITRREDRDAVAAATQNLLLGAHARGLGAMWRTGTMADEPEMLDALGVAAPHAVVAFIYLGHPAVDPPARPRRPAAEVTRWFE